jgi:cytochrome P450
MSAAGQLMLEMDPPDHTRYRKLVNRGFTPKVIRSLEQHLHEMSVRIVDRALADGGECDFVVDVAAELPLEAIAEFLGVPFEDRHKLFDWSNRFIGSEDPEYVVSDEDLTEAQVEMFMYANAMGVDRKANPTGDIVSNLVNAVIDGDQLSDMDFNLFFLLLSVAGNETTRNAISGGLAALSRFPDQRKLMLDNLHDEDFMDRAVDEIVRYVTPVLGFIRTVTRDHTYRNTELKEGDRVLMLYGSANRDERVFDRADELDLTRDPNPHLGFGIGQHFCLGANLARMELKTVFQELLTRLPDISTPPDFTLDRGDSTLVLALQHMPVTFSAPEGCPAHTAS